MPGFVVNIIAIAAIVLIVAGAVFYIVKTKKKGVKCIGCPYSKGCTSCNCGKTTEKQ